MDENFLLVFSRFLFYFLGYFLLLGYYSYFHAKSINSYLEEIKVLKFLINRSVRMFAAIYTLLGITDHYCRIIYDHAKYDSGKYGEKLP